MSVTSEQYLWVIMYFSHCSFPSTIIEAVLESYSSSLGHRRMSQNQMWSSLPFEGTIYPLIFNVVIYMISFSSSILVCFSVSPLPFVHLFPFPVFIWLCCGSSWFSNILTKTVDGFALAGTKLELWTLLPMKDSSSDFNFLLLTFLQAILSLHALFRPQRPGQSVCPEFEAPIHWLSFFWDSLLTFQHQNLWFFSPERQQIF